MPQLLIESEYSLGQIVYLKTDTDQRPGIIIGICIRPGGLLYDIQRSTSSDWYYAIELSATKDILITTTD